MERVCSQDARFLKLSGLRFGRTAKASLRFENTSGIAEARGSNPYCPTCESRFLALWGSSENMSYSCHTWHFDKRPILTTLCCSVTPGKKREPFLGKTIFSGAATKKRGKKGATEQLSTLPKLGKECLASGHHYGYHRNQPLLTSAKKAPANAETGALQTGEKEIHPHLIYVKVLCVPFQRSTSDNVWHER